MSGSIGSRVFTLARAQLAMALTVADGMQRCVGLTAKYGEDVADALAAIVRDTSKPEGRGWDRAAAEALAGYRDYVRELAALPGIASMHYYEQLDQLRVGDGARRRPGPAVPPPTSSMLAFAASLVSSTSGPPDRPSEPPPAQS